ncbi:hypothetical protein H5410_057835 [Solanum commersonii]|uniref:Uncharacterized protein n=1 Tax=Solanum commersonii TaxID=4109 RepID=A0A9J5WQW1_SOLCO|nr:hypothetical protein H5410_057835 [Solanum commersonii]
MLLQITYQDKAIQTETEKEDTIEKMLKIITTLCTKMDSMDNEIQKLKTNEDNLKSKASQQHNYKNAELRQSEDGKNPELKGDDGKLLKTHTVCLNTAAGTSQRVIEKHKNSNLNQLFEKPFTPRLTPKSELANNYLNENAIWSYYVRDQLMIYFNSRELRKSDMDEVQRWILSLLKPEGRPTTRALKEGFILAELLTRYYKLIGHKYPDHICSQCNGEDNIIQTSSWNKEIKTEAEDKKIR